MRSILYHFLILFAALALPAKAWAYDYNEFVQVQCLEDLNILRIDLLGASGKITSKGAVDHQKRLWTNHGIRELYTMIGTIRLIDENGKPSEDDRNIRMVVKDPIQTSCTLVEQLEDGTQMPRTYDIHIKPYFFNTNAMGRCGGFVTFELTLTSGDQVLVDHLRFDSECSKNYWYQHNKDMALGGLSSIGLYPENRRIRMSGGLLEEYEDKFVFKSSFNFDEDLPITHEKVYGRRKENE